MASSVVVIGSSNMDLITYTTDVPLIGQTIRGNDFKMGFGGKGANQCIACGRLGVKASMITKVGQDTFGQDTIKNYQKNGVDTTYVYTTAEHPSGMAQITVDGAGRNMIIIVSGANDALSESDVSAARGLLGHARVVCCQLEIPLSTTIAALRIAKQEAENVNNKKLISILNPAPAPKASEVPHLPKEFYTLCDIMIPNETELAELTSMSVNTEKEIESAARVLISRGVGKVIVTLGSRGCMLVERDGEATIVPVSPPVSGSAVVDTTGAGDCFIGALACLLSRDVPLRLALQGANTVAALSVQKRGTQTSYPDKETVLSKGFALPL
eukprot:TRINITY_DN2913_c0_g1_i1.p2 TRINITY_DN2913_c0_g1~~TRINITY_DN2913_c0_g1_i1.p2  ORF type:complete len:336 (+),score=51.06 TRINITY_DN2913_c0_g1_i1:29-1009(+)